MNELLNIDCMEYMRGLDDGAFDVCLTSPPYNMNLRVNGKGDGYCSRQIVKELSTKYTSYSDNLPMLEYQSLLSELIMEACRVSKIVFLNIQQITGNKPALFAAIGENSHLLKETIIWDKGAGQPAIGDGVLNSCFEFVFVFGGNPIARAFDNPAFTRGTESNIFRMPPKPRSVGDHGAGFPIELPLKILGLLENVGSVFDPFLGTGTTAIAAHHYGFDFVGCEIDKGYYDAAVARITEETRQVDMFAEAAL